jgi:hypothetical protein
MGRHFQAKAGTQEIPRSGELDSCPGFHRGKLGIAGMTKWDLVKPAKNFANGYAHL